MTEASQINLLNLYLILTASCLLLFAVLLWRWLAGDKLAGSTDAQSDDERDRENLRLYKAAEQELSQQLERGELDESSFQTLLIEAQDELLGVVSDGSSDKNVIASSNTSLSRLFAPGVLLVLLASALWIYFPQGLSLGANDQAKIVQQLDQLRESSSASEWQRSAHSIDDWLEQVLSKSALGSQEHQRFASLQAQINAGLGRYQKSFDRYKQLSLRNPEDVFLAVNVVESEYFLRSSQKKLPLFTSDMKKTLDEVLSSNPDFPTALSLRGTAAFEQENYNGALQDWRRAESLLPPGSPTAQQIRQGILIAEARASGRPLGESIREGNQAAGASEGSAEVRAYIDVTVDIDRSQLKADEWPDTLVFVFARPVEGPGIPLAAKRLQLSDLPTKLRLTQNDRMMGSSILDHDKVVIGARLARSGSPVGISGDLESGVLVVTVNKVPDGKTLQAEISDEVQLMINILKE